MGDLKGDRTMSKQTKVRRLMTEDHEQWERFRGGLYGAVKDRGCDHTARHTEVLLEVLGFTPEEIQASVGALAEQGGYCDCEILMNCG
jgi:hypothetical protein